jgi:hypothetical protein
LPDPSFCKPSKLRKTNNPVKNGRMIIIGGNVYIIKPCDVKYGSLPVPDDELL